MSNIAANASAVWLGKLLTRDDTVLLQNCADLERREVLRWAFIHRRRAKCLAAMS
jgi:hypothetical protein